MMKALSYTILHKGIKIGVFVDSSGIELNYIDENDCWETLLGGYIEVDENIEKTEITTIIEKYLGFALDEINEIKEHYKRLEEE